MKPNICEDFQCELSWSLQFNSVTIQIEFDIIRNSFNSFFENWFQIRRSRYFRCSNHKRVFRLRIFNEKEKSFEFIFTDPVIDDPIFAVNTCLIPDPFRFRLIGYSDEIIFYRENTSTIFGTGFYPVLQTGFLSEDNTIQDPEHPSFFDFNPARITAGIRNM